MAVPVETLFQRLGRWGLFIAFWTFLGLFNAGQSYIIRRIALDFALQPRRRHCYRRRGLVLVGGASPLDLFLGSSLSLDQRSWPTSLPLHWPSEPYAPC